MSCDRLLKAICLLADKIYVEPLMRHNFVIFFNAYIYCEKNLHESRSIRQPLDMKNHSKYQNQVNIRKSP